MNQLLQIEWLKLKRSKIIPIILLLPLFSVLFGRLFILQTKKPPSWELLSLLSLVSYSTIMLPFTIVIIMILLTRVEYSHNGWKQLLALPVTRIQVYFAKLSIGIMLLLLCTLIFLIAFIGTGYTLHIDQPLPAAIIAVPFQMILAALPMIAFQFVISFHVAHVSIPFGLGTLLTLSSFLIGQSERFWIYDPWAYPMNIALSQATNHTTMFASCIVLFLVFVTMGLFYFQKKDIV
ncbi:ABC transporter permease [Ectobacillus polymachus]|uniref:ABC transporter permease n=1 Tax=Ectobacillus polymachus TaxID=1508806 RepID=UPI003A88EB26